jgi:hypothetical protein
MLHGQSSSRFVGQSHTLGRWKIHLQTGDPFVSLVPTRQFNRATNTLNVRPIEAWLGELSNEAL